MRLSLFWQSHDNKKVGFLNRLEVHVYQIYGIDIDERNGNDLHQKIPSGNMVDSSWEREPSKRWEIES